VSKQARPGKASVRAKKIWEIVWEVVPSIWPIFGNFGAQISQLFFYGLLGLGLGLVFVGI